MSSTYPPIHHAPDHGLTPVCGADPSTYWTRLPVAVTCPACRAKLGLRRPLSAVVVGYRGPYPRLRYVWPGRVVVQSLDGTTRVLGVTEPVPAGWWVLATIKPGLNVRSHP